MRELIMLAKVSKRMLKAVIKVCKRGERQTMYADNDIKHLLESAHLDANTLARFEAAKKEATEKEVKAQKAANGLSGKKMPLRNWAAGMRKILPLRRRQDKKTLMFSSDTSHH
jgi:hypothetical protein